MQVNPIDQARDERSFLFSKSIRRVLFYSGLFVLYSQVVSAGLTGVYRYSLSELSFGYGGDPDMFDPWTFTLLQPPEGIGTINDLQAIGWKIEYSPIRYALWTIFPPIFGSVGLLFASIAGTGRVVRCLVVLGSCLGIAAAILIKLDEFTGGSIGWAWHHMTRTHGSLPNPPHPIYGYAELIGSLHLPIATYLALVVYIVVSSTWGLIGWSIRAVRNRHN
jgi:hypothetical protein